MSKKTAKVWELAEPIAKTEGLELVDVEYVKEGENWILRVFIENRDGEINIDHCERVSKMLSNQLDEEKLFTESYILEVSSPGLERPLKTEADYERFIGELIDIKTFAPVNGKKEYTGELMGIEDDIVKIKGQNNKGVIEIPFHKIAQANLTFDF